MIASLRSLCIINKEAQIISEKYEFMEAAINPLPADHDCQAFQTAWNQTRRRVTRRLVRVQAVCHSVNMSSKF